MKYHLLALGAALALVSPAMGIRPHGRETIGMGHFWAGQMSIAKTAQAPPFALAPTAAAPEIPFLLVPPSAPPGRAPVGTQGFPRHVYRPGK